MKSLQDYIDTFRNIAYNLNLQGDSVEILVQMLANASYISEIENIAYAQESSLERATLINSKIQLCVDNMYSVFRGSCPRVVLNIKPTKPLEFTVFQKLLSGNGFDIYYLGYYPDQGGNTETTTGTSAIQTLDGVSYSDVSFVAEPTDSTTTHKIVGLLCRSTIEKEWDLDKNNTYYIDCLENNLSNDMWVKIYTGNTEKSDDGWEYFDTTREFSDHIINGDIFDLTLPSFGSRLYVADIFREVTANLDRDTSSSATSGTKIKANYFVYSSLEDYNLTAIKQIKPRGAQLLPFESDFLGDKQLEEYVPGIILIDSVGRDDLNTIHYKASRERYVNSILRSNSDLGVVLEEMFPELIVLGGTNYVFSNNEDGSKLLTIYYIPTTKMEADQPGGEFTPAQKQNFIESRAAYYVSDNIDITPGTKYRVQFTVDVEIYQSGDDSLSKDIVDILSSYTYKFDINIEKSIKEMEALISKLSNVKRIINLSYSIDNGMGELIDEADIDTRFSYYVFDQGGPGINTVKS